MSNVRFVLLACVADGMIAIIHGMIAMMNVKRVVSNQPKNHFQNIFNRIMSGCSVGRMALRGNSLTHTHTETHRHTQAHINDALKLVNRSRIEERAREKKTLLWNK